MIRQFIAPYYHNFYNFLMAGRRKKFYGSFIKPGDLCFDIGANMGDRTAIFLNLAASVVAVEPQPACVQKLTSRFGSQVRVIAKGVGASEGELPMHISDANTLSSFSLEWIHQVQQDRFSQYNWSETITVPITTLDQLIADYGVPAFCKIDVEGFEVEVLRGLSRPLPMLSLEYAVPEAKTNLLDAIDRLDLLSGATRFNYSPGESMKMALPDYVSSAQFREIIQSQSFEKTLFGDIYTRM